MEIVISNFCKALVVQRIGRELPELAIEVRFLSRASNYLLKNFKSNFMYNISKENYSETPRDKLLIDYLIKDSDKRRRKFMEALFESKESQKFVALLEIYNINQVDVPKFIADQNVFDLIGIMLDNDKKYKFQLAVLLSRMSIKDMPPELVKKIKTIETNSQFKITIGCDDWLLCDETESFLEESMRSNLVLLVNDKLLVKFAGKLTALCLKTFSTIDGFTFLKGNWYSLVDTTLRTITREAFDDGISKINLKEGKWALMRPLAGCRYKNSAEFMEETEKYILSLPDKSFRV